MSSEQSGTIHDSARDSRGRFGVGNGGGPGNPHAQRVALLRSAMLAEVKPEDLAAIMRTLLELAKEGNLQAAKLVLTYTLGKPEPLAKAEGAELPVKRETSGGVGRPLLLTSFLFVTPYHDDV